MLGAFLALLGLLALGLSIFWLFPRGVKSGECLLSRPPGALDEARRELKRSQKERLS